MQERLHMQEAARVTVGRGSPHAEGFTLRGDISLEVRGPDGALRQRLDKQNLIVQTGHNFVATALCTSSTSPFNAIAVGTGSTAPSSGDTALVTELVRHATTTNSAASNVTTFAYTFGPGTATGAITEAGIFNNSVSGGTLFARVVFSVVNVAAADTLTVTWTITC